MMQKCLYLLGLLSCFFSLHVGRASLRDVSFLLRHAEQELKNPLLFREGLYDLQLIFNDQQYRSNQALERKFIELVKQIEVKAGSFSDDTYATIRSFVQEVFERYQNSRYAMDIAFMPGQKKVKKEASVEPKESRVLPEKNKKNSSVERPKPKDTTMESFFGQCRARSSRTRKKVTVKKTKETKPKKEKKVATKKKKVMKKKATSDTEVISTDDIELDQQEIIPIKAKASKKKSTKKKVAKVEKDTEEESLEAPLKVEEKSEVAPKKKGRKKKVE